MKKLLLSLILTFVLLVSSVMAIPQFTTTGLPTSVEVTSAAYSGIVTITADDDDASATLNLGSPMVNSPFTISLNTVTTTILNDYTVSGWTPSCSDVDSTMTLQIDATNSNGEPNSVSVPIVVSPNAASTLAALASGSLNVFYSQTVTASDEEGNPVTFDSAAAVTNLPAWASFNPTTGLLSGTPTAEGTVMLTFTVDSLCHPDTEVELPLTIIGPNALLIQYQAQFNNLTTILDGYEDTLDNIEEDIDDACEDRDEAIEDEDANDQDDAEDDLDDSVDDLEDLDDDLKDLENDEAEDLEDLVDSLPSSTSGRDTLLDNIEEDLYDEIDDLRSDIQSDLEEAESYCEVPQPAIPDEPETSTPAAPVVVAQPQPSAGVVTQTASQTVPVQQSSPKEQVAIVSTNSAPQPQPSYPSASRVVIDSSKQQGTTDVWMIAGFSVLAVLLVVLLIVLAVALFRR